LAIRILGPGLGALESPGTMALVAFAGVLLGPLIIAAVLRIRSQAWEWPYGFFSSWWLGLRSGLVFLLFTLPYLLTQGALKYSTVRGLVEADSQFEAILQAFILASCVMVLPFWCLMLFRRLSRTLAGKSLVEPLRRAGIVDAREDGLSSS
jgi:hypothetical protein